MLDGLRTRYKGYNTWRTTNQTSLLELRARLSRKFLGHAADGGDRPAEVAKRQFVVFGVADNLGDSADRRRALSRWKTQLGDHFRTRAKKGTGR